MINVIRAYIHMEHLLAIIIARQLTSLCINIHVDIYIYYIICTQLMHRTTI